MKQVEVGQAITGFDYYEPVVESAGYHHRFGKTETFVPSAVFCPECSELREHNPRTGKVELKERCNSEIIVSVLFMMKLKLKVIV